MQLPPSAKEIKDAAAKTGCDAIPYPDLRDKGKKEYAKQKDLCKNFSCDSLTNENEIAAAQTRAKVCRAQRIAVRTIFEQAIGRVKGVLQKMIPGDPMKPLLTDILKELERSKKGHEDAIDEVNNAFLKCEEKLKKLGK
jgi:hypothetical protein